MSSIVGGTIVWNLDVDASKFNDGLEKASNKAKNAAKDVGDSSKEISKSITSSFDKSVDSSTKLAIGLGAIATAGIISATKMVQLAADTEMLRTNIDVLAGSTEKGVALFEDLYDFAARTPFETTDLVQATQTMLGYGISVDDAKGYLQVLGDISLGNKNKLQGITFAFSQIMGTGRLLGQDLRQLISNGFNPLTEISKITGETMQELKDRMEDGGISADEVAKAFESATKEGGLFYKGMEKGSKTLTGIWSTMMDEVNTFVRGLVGLSRKGEVIKGSFFDKLKKVIIDFTKTLKDNFQQIKDTLGKVVDLAIQNLPILTGIIVGALTPAFIGLATSIWAALAPLLPFIAIGVILALIVDAIIKQLGGWDEAMRVVNNTLRGLEQVYKTYLEPALKALWKQITEELIPELKRLWYLIEPVIIPVLKFLATVILGLLVIAIAFLIEVFKLVTKQITKSIKDFNDMIVFFKNFGARVEEFGRELYRTLIEPWVKAGITLWENIKWIWRMWTGLWDDMVSYAKSIPDRIASFMWRVYDNIMLPWRNARRGIEDLANEIRNAIDRINPFHRESPSLVDNVIAGVKEIKKQYAGLTSIQLPAISSQSMPLTDIESETGQTYSKKDVTVNIGEVRNMQDIEMISREIGYRFSLI